MKGLKPLSGLYRSVVSLKNHLYDKEYVQSVELPISVISLGNLTMGGTGKTPLTDLCLQHFQRRRVKVGVVSRNYRARVHEAAKVDIKHPQAAAYYGDEPVLLATRHPEADFFVGPRKYETAQWAFENYNPELLLVDDGFQHRQLHRDLDIVILDATETVENYACVPAGRAREPWSSLSRAHVIVITKANLVEASALEELVNRVEKFNKPVICMAYEVLRLREYKTGEEQILGSGFKERVFLVSGIAQPKSFESSLQKLQLEIADHKIFKDHHPYTSANVQSLLKRWEELGRPRIVTTEKDMVKLKALWPTDLTLWYAPLELHIQGQEKLFYEILDQVLH